METRSVVVLGLGIVAGGVAAFFLNKLVDAPAPSANAPDVGDRLSPSARGTFSVWMAAEGPDGFPAYPTELRNLSDEKATELMVERAESYARETSAGAWDGLDNVQYLLVNDTGKVIHRMFIYAPDKTT